jgi:hypothetical protein
VEYACFPVFKIIFRVHLPFKFKQLNADTITCLKMGNAELVPITAKNVGTHFSYWAVVFYDFGWLHDQIPAHDFGIKLNRGFKVGNRYAYV